MIRDALELVAGAVGGDEAVFIMEKRLDDRGTFRHGSNIQGPWNQ